MSSFLLRRSVPSDCSTKRCDQRGCSCICCMRSGDTARCCSGGRERRRCLLRVVLRVRRTLPVGVALELLIAQPISMSSLQLLALAINTISMRSAEMHCNRVLEKRANTNTVTPILNSRFRFKKINCISKSIFK